jgi:hypothetical protein
MTPAETATPQASPWPPEYLDLGGMAFLLSSSTKQIRRLLAAGKLPAADINLSTTGSPKGRRWRRTLVLSWLAGGRQV